jgi:hypothetical protein
MGGGKPREACGFASIAVVTGRGKIVGLGVGERRAEEQKDRDQEKRQPIRSVREVWRTEMTIGK